MIIRDKQLAKNLEDKIKQGQYSIGFIVPSSREQNKHYIFFFNTGTRDIRKFTFFIKNSYYKFTSSEDVEMKMNEKEFIKYVKKKFKIGLANNCVQNQIEASNLSDTDRNKAGDYFNWFSTSRLNDKRFDALCKKIFGIEFDLRNGCAPSDLITLDEKKAIYLLVQDFSGMGGFAAIVNGNQIQNFMAEYDKLIQEIKPTYKQTPEKLPQQPITSKENANFDATLMEQEETKTQINKQEDYPTLSMEDFEELDPYSVHSL